MVIYQSPQQIQVNQKRNVAFKLAISFKLSKYCKQFEEGKELEKTTNSSSAITSIDLQEINIQMEFCHLQSSKHLFRRSMLWPNIFVLLKSNTSFYQQFLVGKPILYEFLGSCQDTVTGDHEDS